MKRKHSLSSWSFSMSIFMHNTQKKVKVKRKHSLSSWSFLMYNFHASSREITCQKSSPHKGQICSIEPAYQITLINLHAGVFHGLFWNLKITKVFLLTTYLLHFSVYFICKFTSGSSESPPAQAREKRPGGWKKKKHFYNFSISAA